MAPMSDEPGLFRARDELRFFSRELRVLGTYSASPFRLAHEGR